MPTSKHTVQAYDAELEEIDRLILAMGGLVERQLKNSIEALIERDDELARAVVEADHKTDEHEREIDERATRVIALRQPMADDLRHVLTALKIAANLERMGDLAANIAKRSMALDDDQQVPQREAMKRLGNAVYGMVGEVLNAYRDHDVDPAQRVWRQDEAIDEMYRSVFLAILADMLADSRLIASGTHAHFIAKNIERIGDHATNIAEMVTYMIAGRTVEAERPKANAVASVEEVRQVAEEES